MPTTLTRSLLVILIPGGVATTPWLVLVALSFPAVTGYYDHYPLVGDCLAFALFVVIGSLFEGINTFFEVRWDRARETEHAVKENWYAYLAHVGGTEPVGFRYISRLATTMYFELSMTWAAALFWIGVAFWSGGAGAAWYWPVAALAAAIISSIYFHWQAGKTHGVLCATRAEIMKRIA